MKNSQLSKKRPRSLARRILVSIVEGVADANAMSLGARSGYRIYATRGPGYAKWVRAERDRRAVRDAYKGLVRRGLVRLRRTSERITAELTDKGKIAVLAEVAGRAKRLQPNEQCVISFDIPMGARSARDTFRRLLKKMGCTALHQSAWVTDRDIADTVDDLVRYLDIERWVTVLIARKWRRQ